MSDTNPRLAEAIAALRAAVEAEEGVAREHLDTGDFAASPTALARAEAMQELAKSASELIDQVPESEPTDHVSRRNLGRLPHVVKTPERNYREPTLQALVEVGASARWARSSIAWGEMMDSELLPIDRETLSSDPNQLRWRNTAQWTLRAMVENVPCGRIARAGRGRLPTKDGNISATRPHELQ